MAITTSGMYWVNFEKALILTLGVSWESTAQKMFLVTDSVAPNFDTDTFRSTYTANEVSGTGYDAGGQALVSPVVSISSGMKFDFDDPAWTTSTITNAMAGVVSSGDATDTADEMNFLLDFVTAVSTVAGTLTVAINAAGAVTMTAS